jgi:imidazolonepropionase-like amidohydrolase
MKTHQKTVTRRGAYMKRMTLGLMLVVLPAVGSGQQPAARSVVVNHVTLINPNASPQEDVAIVFSGARIASVGRASDVRVPTGAEVIEGRGKFVVPGLADFHHHLASGHLNVSPTDTKTVFRQLLAFGITSIFAMHIDMPSFVDLKKIASEDTAAVPRFFAVGRGFATFGGYRPNTPEQARAAVRELKTANVDAIKIAYDDMSWVTKQSIPMLRPDVMATIIDESHKQGLKVYVHAPILKYAKDVLRAGADGFVHGIVSDPVDDEFIDLMKKNHAVYVSTLSLFEACADMSAWTRRLADFDQHGTVKTTLDFWKNPDAVRQFQAIYNRTSYVAEHMPVLKRNLMQTVGAGVPVVTGTDTGFPGVVAGVSSLAEPVLHVEAGLSPQTTLQAATINAARMVNREKDMGSVAEGKFADMLLLDANPIEDMSNLRKIYRVIKGGVVLNPAEIGR